MKIHSLQEDEYHPKEKNLPLNEEYYYNRQMKAFFKERENDTMENILEWTEKIGKNMRNKPNQQLKKELYHRIENALKNSSNTVIDCVTAFCKFSPKVIDEFYNEYYWNYPIEIRTQWDHAILDWANTNTGKQTFRATIRIVPIIRLKLKNISLINEVLPELQWLSLNEDNRSVKEFEKLREDSEVNNLKKLLSLDMSIGEFGKELIFKMYAILFSDEQDKEVQKQYSDFLSRNGKQIGGFMENHHDISDESDKNNAGTWKEMTELEAVTKHEKKDESLKDQKTELESPVDIRNNNTQDAGKSMPMEELADGLNLAEALVKWVKNQTSNANHQTKKIKDQAFIIAQQQKEIKHFKEREKELRCAVVELKETVVNLEANITAFQTETTQLRLEKEKGEKTINQLQQMTQNSIKQELDGFKAKIARALSNDIKDFKGDYAEEEKADVYFALLEDMIDILNRSGIMTEAK